MDLRKTGMEKFFWLWEREDEKTFCGRPWTRNRRADYDDDNDDDDDDDDDSDYDDDDDDDDEREDEKTFSGLPWTRNRRADRLCQCRPAQAPAIVLS